MPTPSKSAEPMDLFRSGQLDAAVESALARVKRSPTDTAARFQLAELACIAGDLERADRQLDTVVNQDHQAAVGAALFRQLIRAEMARRECFTQGRVPEFIGEPSTELTEQLRKLVISQSGTMDDGKSDEPEIAPESAPAAVEASPMTFLVNGEPVDDLRDLDDLLAPVLEVHTTTGKYFWVGWNQIESMDVHPPKRPIDLLWRQATLSIAGGPDGEVYLPAIYLPPSSNLFDDEAVRLGRATDWVTTPDGLVRGRGQKSLLAGDVELPWMSLQTIEAMERDA